MGVFKDIFEMLRGMTITSKHLTRHAVTIQYPEERDTIPERSRGIVVLLSDKETGKANCTSCMLCMRVCPTAAIRIVSPRGEDKKRQLQEFDVDNSLCCFCGLCEEVCNFSAIKMATMYEFATQDKEELHWDMKKLLDMGKDVPYTPRPKKKPKPKPAPKAPVVSQTPTVAPADAAAPDVITEKKPETDKSEAEKPVATDKPRTDKSEGANDGN